MCAGKRIGGHNLRWAWMGSWLALFAILSSPAWSGDSLSGVYRGIAGTDLDVRVTFSRDGDCAWQMLESWEYFDDDNDRTYVLPPLTLRGDYDYDEHSGALSIDTDWEGDVPALNDLLFHCVKAKVKSSSLTVSNDERTITGSAVKSEHFYRLGSGSWETDDERFPVSLSTEDADTKLRNLSTRGKVKAGDSKMIAGFVIQGSAPKKVAVAGWGPSLESFGVHDTLDDPVLAVLDGQTVLAANDNWRDYPARDELISLGVQPSHDRESAVLLTLNPGQYTAVLSGTGGGTGNSLIAVWDMDSGDSRLTNLSTRGHVGDGDEAIIAGFIIQGAEDRKVAITGWGPSLSDWGVPDVLDDPVLTVFADQTPLGSCDDWKDSPYEDEARHEDVDPKDDEESVVILRLAPGDYTAILSGAHGETGNGLVAVWDLGD